MSVINRMLQELEERHDDAVQKRMPGLVRAVPARLPATSRRPWMAVLSVVLAVLLGVLVWQVAVRWTKKSNAPLAPLAIAPPLPPQANLIEPLLLTTDSLKPLPAPEVEAAQPTPEESAPTAQPVKPNEAKPERANHFDSTKREPPTIPPTIPKDKPDAVTKTKPGAEPVNTTSFKQVSTEQHMENRYREALSLISQGRMLDAQAALEEILRLAPRNLSARQVLLGMHVEAKRYVQAEQLLQEGLQLNIAPVSQAMALARVQFERGDQTAALATLEKYAPQAGNQGEYHGFHAALLQRVGRHAEAIAQFQAALKTHPNQANWLMGLGISLQSERRYPEAEQAYLRARASNALTPDLQAFVEQRLRQVQQ
ncbi:MAG: tetratricopeptide repeat protein, partial [Burkholderiales bacterium]|nr:tetratricopeptide repeat protein [Burkholderiales bacterium]